MSNALRHIVLVEDEPDIRQIVQISLELAGSYTVTAYENGHDALADLYEQPADLVLLDVMMPGIDGPAILQAMRAHPATAAVPVVFLTAKVQPKEVERYRALGALDVISKPFDPLTLPNQVQALWAQCQAA